MGSKRVRHDWASFTQVQAHESVGSPLSPLTVLTPPPSLVSLWSALPDLSGSQPDRACSATLSLLFVLNKHTPFWNTPCLEILFQPLHRSQHIYTMEDYSAIKRNEIMPFAATWIELETVILSEVRGRQISYCLWVEYKKKGTNELIYKTNRITDVEIKHRYWG